jgi:hypothetical protein
VPTNIGSVVDAMREEVIRADRLHSRVRGQYNAGPSDFFEGTTGRRLAFLDSTHPIWDANHSLWRRNERRLRGSDEVLDELRRFDWESDLPARGEEKSHYQIRRERATYLNFAEMFATTMVGHLTRRVPQPGAGLNFGTLGTVRREDSAGAVSRAEMVYYNADGVGNDGSQWDNFWAGAEKRAMATGHRWIMVEAPRQAPASFQDELDGLRPYLVEYSPRDVPNWSYDSGRLQWAVVRVDGVDRPRVNGRGQMVRGKGKGYLLMVRYGCEELGPDFRVGGWWLFDSRKAEVAEGRWLNTRGEIPMFPLFYEREPENHGERPTMSRPGITELGALGVSYMDLTSARVFDAWDAAQSVTYFRGVDQEGFNLATDKLAEGSRYVPLPLIQAGVGQYILPEVSDGSSGAVTEGVFNSLSESMFRDAQRMGVSEATSVPDSSGISKVAGFNEEKSPRLALCASHMEQAQNTAIYFLELRWGFARPTGSVTWTRKFDLVALTDEVNAIFNLEKLIGISSKTLNSKLMVMAAEERGFLSDDTERETVKNEFGASAQAAEDRQNALNTLAASAGVSDFSGS